MEWLSIALVGAMVVVLLLNSRVTIPRDCFGVPTVLGRRTTRILTEGLQFKIPMIESISKDDIYLRNKRLVVEHQVFTEDNLQVRLGATLTWEANLERATRFVQEYKNLEHDLVDAVKASLRTEAGKLDSDTIIRDAALLEGAVMENLRSQDRGIEREYGIRLRRLKIPVVIPSEEQTQAFEAQRLRELREDAEHTTRERVGDFIAAMDDRGLGGEQVLEWEQVMRGLVEKKIDKRIYDVPGLADVLTKFGPYLSGGSSRNR